MDERNERNETAVVLWSQLVFAEAGVTDRSVCAECDRRTIQTAHDRYIVVTAVSTLYQHLY